MKVWLKKNLLTLTAFAVTLLSSLFWVALRVNYSGISKFLGADTNPSFLVMNLPLMVCAAAWLGFGLVILGMAAKKKWPLVAGLVTGVVMSAGAVAVILFGAKDYLRFINVHFFRSLAVTACLLAFAGALYFPITGKKSWKALLLAGTVVAAVISGYGLRPCKFSCGPAVYAVEDTYQIVFATSDSAIAWVEVDGQAYYDLYAGSMRSAEGVHKITLPQAVLDGAGSYSIHARQMIYRGPFGGYLGKELRECYDFFPVDSTDGLQYLALSDVHERLDAAVSAAAAAFPEGEGMDFLVMLGDIVSMVETEADALMATELAHRITGGTVPVLYARGNHEIKGEYAEDFSRYVGSLRGDFCYSVTLGRDVFAVVLDMGEDHEDDWWEYYGTACFDSYRDRQTRMLEDLLEGNAPGDRAYRMALCHIPFAYVDKHGYFEDHRLAWTALLNEMGMDIGLSGHKHKLMQFLPGAVVPEEPLIYTAGYAGTKGMADGGYMTDVAFPAFLVGNHSLSYQGLEHGYVAMAVTVDLEAGKQYCCYVSSSGQVLSGVYAFAGTYTEQTFRQIVTDLRDGK